MPDTRQTFKLEAPGALTTGVKDRWQAPFDGEVVNVSAAEGTSQTVAALVFDLKLNGTTTFPTTTKPTIAVGAVETAAPVKPDVVEFVAGDTFSLDITTAGTGGVDLDVTVQYIAT